MCLQRHPSQHQQSAMMGSWLRGIWKSKIGCWKSKIPCCSIFRSTISWVTWNAFCTWCCETAWPTNGCEAARAPALSAREQYRWGCFKVKIWEIREGQARAGLKIEFCQVRFVWIKHESKKEGSQKTRHTVRLQAIWRPHQHVGPILCLIDTKKDASSMHFPLEIHQEATPELGQLASWTLGPAEKELQEEGSEVIPKNLYILCILFRKPSALFLEIFDIPRCHSVDGNMGPKFAETNPRISDLQTSLPQSAMLGSWQDY